MRAQDAKKNVEKYYSYGEIMKDITEWVEVKSSHGRCHYSVMFDKYDWPPMYRTKWFKKKSISHDTRDKVIEELKNNGFNITTYYYTGVCWQDSGWVLKVEW